MIRMFCLSGQVKVTMTILFSLIPYFLFVPKQSRPGTFAAAFSVEVTQHETLAADKSPNS